MLEWLMPSHLEGRSELRQPYLHDPHFFLLNRSVPLITSGGLRCLPAAIREVVTKEHAYGHSPPGLVSKERAKGHSPPGLESKEHAQGNSTPGLASKERAKGHSPPGLVELVRESHDEEGV